MPADTRNTEVLFVVCEDARTELGNKVSLLGLYVGNEVLFPPNSNYIIPSLTFAFLIRYGKTGDAVHPSIIAPNGTRFDFPDPGWRLEYTKSAVFSIKLQNFQLEKGEYQVGLLVGKTPQQYAVFVGEQPPSAVG